MLSLIFSKIALKVACILAVRALGKAINESSLASRHPKACKFIKRFITNFIIHHFDNICDYGQKLFELAA